MGYAVQIHNLEQMDGKGAVLIFLDFGLRREEAVTREIINLRPFGQLLCRERSFLFGQEIRVRLQRIHAGQNVVVRAAGQSAFIPTHIHEDASLHLRQCEGLKPARDVFSRFGKDFSDFDGVITLRSGCFGIEGEHSFVVFGVPGAEHSVQFHIVSAQIQPVFELPVVLIIAIVDACAHRFHRIGAGQDVVLRAAGQCALVALDFQDGILAFESERQRFEPERDVDAAGIVYIVDLDAVVLILCRIQIQDKKGLIESRLTGAEIAVQHQIIGDHAGKVQPVLWHPVLLTIQIGVRQNSVIIGIRERVPVIGEDLSLGYHVLQHAPDRHAEGLDLLGGKQIGEPVHGKDNASILYVIAADLVAVIDLVAFLVSNGLSFGFRRHLEIGMLLQHVRGKIGDELLL